jgi:hypothetical protein
VGQILSLSAIILFLTVSSCSLFEPRDSFEEPDDQKVMDIQWISHILECPQQNLDKGIKFDDYLVTELFANEFDYYDVNDRKDPYSKELFINRINTIGNPQSVIWNDVGTCTIRNDTCMVRDSKYELTFANGYKAVGQSDFEIYKQQGKYRIVKWTNYPSGGKVSYLTPIGG